MINCVKPDTTVIRNPQSVPLAYFQGPPAVFQQMYWTEGGKLQGLFFPGAQICKNKRENR